MMKLLTLQIFSCLFLFSKAKAQYADCITGLEICNKDSLSLTFTKGNDFAEVTRLNSCFTPISDQNPNVVEKISIWLKWKVVRSGTLTFVITPSVLRNDIDFAVYKIDNKDCSNLKRVRCNASGADAVCSLLGAIGLREGEDDVTEPGGCNQNNPSQNNFLAPLDMVVGEMYALIINDYDNDVTGNGKITFGGTGQIGCISTGLFEDNFVSTTRVYPNPVQSELYIETNEFISKILIVNSLGQVVKIEKGTGVKQIFQSISVANLSKGYYTVQCYNQNGGLNYQKFIKN